MKKILVLGAAGFIGTYLVDHLKKQNNIVIGADYIEQQTHDMQVPDHFSKVDLSVYANVEQLFSDNDIDEVYQLAADFGGAEYIFTGENDADLMPNNVLVNINVLSAMVKHKVKKVLFTSSACVYPEHNQTDPNNPLCTEESAYPANPDSEYGWEKIFSERLYLSYSRNHKIDVRIVRLHNVFGPHSKWQGGKEKAPAALCRKVAQAQDGDTIEILGPGSQTRSFLYIDECIQGFDKIMQSNYQSPLNLGSDEMISINDLAHMISDISGKKIHIKNVPGPMGVMGRVSDNKLIEEVTGWKPSRKLKEGITSLYKWVNSQVKTNT